MAESPYEDNCQAIEHVIEHHLSDKRLGKRQRVQLAKFRQEFCFGRRLAIPTHGSYVRPLYYFGLFLKKDFRNATKRDVRRYLESLDDKSYSVQMWARTSMKVFYRWLLTGSVSRHDAFPSCVAWIKIGSKPPTKICAEDCLSLSEIRQLLTGCRNLRDVAYIKLLLDTGGRAGELLNSRVENVHFEAACPYIEFPVSKTAPRPVPLMDSVHALREWLELHPQRNEPEFSRAFIFVPTKRRNGGAKKYVRADEMLSCLKDIAERAGLKKKIWNHLFRHTAGSFDAALNMNTPMANAKYGWAKGSKIWEMRYAHVRSDDVARWQRKARGLTVLDEKPPMQPKECPRCKESNSWDSIFCRRCAQPLDKMIAPSTVHNADVEKPHMQMAWFQSKLGDYLREKMEVVG